MKRAFRIVAIAGGTLLIVGIGGATWLWSETIRERPMRSLGEMHSLRLVNQSGNPTTLGSIHVVGRPTIVSFWASWCVPCRAETRVLVALRAQHPASELSIIAINIDPDAPKLKQDAFLSETGGRALAQLGGQPETYRALTGRSVIALPTTGFFDRNGRSIVTITSYAPETGEHAVKAALERILSSATPNPA